MSSFENSKDILRCRNVPFTTTWFEPRTFMGSNYWEKITHSVIVASLSKGSRLSFKKKQTRMHSRRMRTTRSSSRGGLHQAHPWEQVPPGPRPSWTRPPVPGTLSRDQAPPRTRHPPGPGTLLQEQAPPHGSRHPACGQTDACKHITLPPNFVCGR